MQTGSPATPRAPGRRRPGPRPAPGCGGPAAVTVTWAPGKTGGGSRPREPAPQRQAPLPKPQPPSPVTPPPPLPPKPQGQQAGRKCRSPGPRPRAGGSPEPSLRSLGEEEGLNVSRSRQTSAPKHHPSTRWRCHGVLRLPVPPDIRDRHHASSPSERFGPGQSSHLAGLDPGRELPSPTPTSEPTVASCSTPSLGSEPIHPFLSTGQTCGHFLSAPSSGRLRQRGARARLPGGPGGAGSQTEGRERAGDRGGGEGLH